VAGKGKQQHIEWLLEGVDSWNARREREAFTPDFEGAKIRDEFEKSGKLADAGRIPLGGADLRKANLGGADLGGADPRGADPMVAGLGGRTSGGRTSGGRTSRGHVF